MGVLCYFIIEKGVNLYYEAINLLKDKKSKDRFRQRLNLELGKAYIESGNYKKGTRYLQKAIKEKNGFTYVKNEAENLLHNTKPTLK